MPTAAKYSPVDFGGRLPNANAVIDSFFNSNTCTDRTGPNDELLFVAAVSPLCQSTHFPSRDPVAKYWESCVQAHVQMIRPWMPLDLSGWAINLNSVVVSLVVAALNRAQRRSREVDSRKVLSGEKASWVMVSWWAANFWCCFHVVVFLFHLNFNIFRKE